ncbi:TIGR00730 family Rossman fold protein [Myroides albus]|uniref:Cytokinin riboside 5'-monophosphate phosphoribohydrolase n=1 Tax=Myroides albus TaxID=2562892 RepID=A0A6I3LIG6_9FLAO|nr:TIGR00730 family Rossman fold protein [Myroides albus]MTG98348.1 TIGR00730 family Rossman fold protein [Myroides albus]UVD80342.1 TIGR00730 family Rossman fold protein [Myroides albus]
MRYTVFCGSSSGFDENFKREAYNLGKALASKTIGLVYGGANVGLMGAVADGCLDHGGEVIGVLPYFLKNVEIEHKALTELFLVESMHDRKAKLNELSHGVIALPGGYGTLEELFEMITWAQLGLHKKPVAILNTDHFYDPLLLMIDKMVEKGFLKQINKEMLIVSDQIEDLLDRMEKYEAPKEGKWITKEK